MSDSRALPAKYYDLAPGMPNDVPFYIARLPSAHAQVLELGCGTGRVTVPLAHHCAFIYGIDHSESMLRICRDKLTAAGLSNAEIVLGDIADFRLDRTFDFIIAPYRVLQNLETDAQVNGLFSGIRRHLRPGGRCILNTFNLLRSREELVTRWSTPDESLDWETPTDGGRVACYARRLGIQIHSFSTPSSCIEFTREKNSLTKSSNALSCVAIILTNSWLEFAKRVSMSLRCSGAMTVKHTVAGPS